jgi:hypothetical protein
MRRQVTAKIRAGPLRKGALPPPRAAAKVNLTMTSRALSRKEFLTLSLTLLGGAAAAGACSSSTYGGGSGATGGTSGSGGSTGSGGTAGTACSDPLPEMQVADATGHAHTVTIPAATLDATTDQTIDTSVTFGHMHAITLAVADLATLKSGGSVTVTSTETGTPAHVHMYTVTCT